MISKRSWKSPTLPLFIPPFNPFTRAKGAVIFSKSLTFTRVFTLCCQASVKLYVASETMSGLICCRKTKISRCSFQFNLRHESDIEIKKHIEVAPRKIVLNSNPTLSKLHIFCEGSPTIQWAHTLSTQTLHCLRQDVCGEER